jgi:hypothetical protein
MPDTGATTSYPTPAVGTQQHPVLVWPQHHEGHNLGGQTQAGPPLLLLLLLLLLAASAAAAQQRAAPAHAGTPSTVLTVSSMS